VLFRAGMGDTAEVGDGARARTGNDTGQLTAPRSGARRGASASAPTSAGSVSCASSTALVWPNCRAMRSTAITPSTVSSAVRRREDCRPPHTGLKVTPIACFLPCSGERPSKALNRWAIRRPSATAKARGRPLAEDDGPRGVRIWNPVASIQDDESSLPDRSEIEKRRPRAAHNVVVIAERAAAA